MKLSHVSESRSTLVKTGRWTGGSDAWPVLTITVIDDAAVRPAVWWGGSLKCHDIISCGSLTPPLRPGQAFSTWPSPFWGGRLWRPDSIKWVSGEAGAIQGSARRVTGQFAVASQGRNCHYRVWKSGRYIGLSRDLDRRAYDAQTHSCIARQTRT